jgi:hypothetical protein
MGAAASTSPVFSALARFTFCFHRLPLGGESVGTAQKKQEEQKTVNPAARPSPRHPLETTAFKISPKNAGNFP